MRWLIRRAVIREPRFGETRQDVLGWTVQPYITLDDGTRVSVNRPTPFGTLRAAHRFASAEAARHEARRRYNLAVADAEAVQP